MFEHGESFDPLVDGSQVLKRKHHNDIPEGQLSKRNEKHIRGN
jgi:hypothetical protein